MCSRPRDFRVLLLSLCILGAFAVGGPASVRAESSQTAAKSGGEPAGYREAITRAIEEYDLGHFTEAREHFARAHALLPNARTLRGLGVADFELRRYVAALDWLKRSLAEDEKRLEGALRRETQALLERAQGYVGQLTVRAKPASFTLSVDGIVTRYAPGDALALEVGDHVIELQAAGCASQRRAVQIQGGQSQTLVVELTPLDVPRASRSDVDALQVQASSVEHSERAPIYKQWWLWTAIGVVVAGAATATALLMNHERPREYLPLTTENTPDGVVLQPLVRQ